MKLERIWTLIVAIVLFAVRYVNILFEGNYSISRYANLCFSPMTNCGWAKFGNVMLIILSIVLLIYFIYYNYEELSASLGSFSEKIKKK
jgi:hypothetical protein